MSKISEYNPNQNRKLYKKLTLTKFERFLILMHI